MEGADAVPRGLAGTSKMVGGPVYDGWAAEREQQCGSLGAEESEGGGTARVGGGDGRAGGGRDVTDGRGWGWRRGGGMLFGGVGGLVVRVLLLVTL